MAISLPLPAGRGEINARNVKEDFKTRYTNCACLYYCEPEFVASVATAALMVHEPLKVGSFLADYAWMNWIHFDSVVKIAVDDFFVAMD